MSNGDNRCQVCGQGFKTLQALTSHARHKHPVQEEEVVEEAEVSAGTRLPSKALPTEVLISQMRLPQIANGAAAVFDAGVEYGMKSILIGVRVAQELSKMGIDQAVPIIKMAQEMRQTEGQVAKETGMSMGGEIAGRLFEYMEQKFPQQKPDIAHAPDPMKGLMARTMETLMNHITGMMFGGQVGPTPGLVDKRNQGGQG